MKTVEEAAAKCKNEKVDSILDASNGYWQTRQQLVRIIQLSILLLEGINIYGYQLESKALVTFFSEQSLEY